MHLNIFILLIQPIGKKKKKKKLNNKIINKRDIKPENILLTFNKSIKLIDFGLGNLYHQNEKLKTPCGSPCYAPPEMIEGKYYNPLKSDIWSSGIVLYTMLCGYLPFEDPDIRICYDKILNGKIDFPEWINDDLIDLFNNILCLNPEKRWSINEIRNHKWFKKYEFANNKIIFKFDDNVFFIFNINF